MTTTIPHNQLLLNYHDAVIYGSDLAILDSPKAWLNDACVNFQMTVLQQQYSNVKFMDPSVVTFLMHQCDEEDLQEFSETMDKECEKYFIPVNDGHASSAVWQRPGAGSHWSLLVILVHGPLYLHFDSVRGNNASAAHDVASIFSKILGHESGSVVKEVNTPQQQNGYDCGIHALAAAEILVHAGIESAKDSEGALSHSKLGQPGFGLETRRKIQRQMKELMKVYHDTKSSGV